MLVERKVAGDWQTIASDSDWNTTVRWRADKKSLVAELSWTLPEGVAAGEYRISHLGYDPAGNQFRGISDPIKIK